MNRTENQKVYPGINPQVKLDHFADEEMEIIKKLSGEWYITNGGNEISLGTKSKYKYLLFKPTDHYKEMFNIALEIIIIFSDYSSFETRTLDAVDYVAKKYQKLRIEKLCSVIISRDIEITSKIKELVKSNQESQLIVPFSYSELIENFKSSIKKTLLMGLN